MKRFFLNWWLLTGLTALLIGLLLVLILPLVAPFMRPWWVRLLVGLTVGGIWAVFAVLRIRKARKAADEIARELAAPSPGDVEAQLLSERMRAALKGFRTASGDKRDYLYSRPWYMIIGPPGAGKTTALLNSGIQFPFSDSALKGAGGTRNLDFWFADEAVLVDTAGRYTSQDSDSAADAKGWDHFLKLLQRARPLQPINGVLVAIGLDEILGCDRQGLDIHAAAVRRRLGELRRTLEVSAPIYILFTKVDLLAGFSEFFEDLDVEGRRAVLGATLPLDAPFDLEGLLAQFDAVTQAMADRVTKRLQEEADPRRRSLILGFPSQLISLRARLARFFQGAFLSEVETKQTVRGFYFTSGVQEGAPLDRILSGMAQVFDAPPVPARPGQGGRAYFLNRLLKEVVFPEAGLVQSDPKAQARRGRQLVAGFAAIGGAALLMTILWGVSFLGNRNLQNHLLGGSQNVGAELRSSGIDLVEVRESDPNLEQSLSLLRALRDLPRGYSDQAKGGAPLSERFGLFQGGHAKAASQAYLETLQRVLLPRILLRLERYLRDHQQEPLQVYEPLKVYLMLGGQGPLDPKAVRAWVTEDWAREGLSGADRAQVREELSHHLDALLADPQFGRVWPSRQAPLDGTVVESARAAVQTLSLADRAYAILRQKAATSDGADWRADTLLASGDRQAFGNGEAVMRLSVPYFFTKPGFERAYQLGLQTVQADLEKDLWVMGADADKAAIRSQVAGVRPGVAALYAQEYVAAWDAVVKALEPADYFTNPAAMGAFTRTPSPLKMILLEVRKNTTFGGGVAGAVAQGLASKLGSATRLGAAATDSGGLDAGKTIQNHFRPLADYVGDGKSAAPIDDFVGAVKAAASANAAAGMAGSGMGGAAAQGQLATAMGQVAIAAAVAPAQMQGFAAKAAKTGNGAAVSSAQTVIGSDYSSNLSPACRSISDNRYPFYGASQSDATASDMLRVLGLNGQFDGFVRDRLKGLLETTGPVWRWRTEDPLAAGLDPVSAEPFQKAAQIRDLITGGLPLKIASAGFGGAVTAAEFSSGGATYRFEPNTVGAKQVIWNLSALPEAHVILYSGTQEIRRFDAQGVWALFRLMDAAQKENAGPTAINATFGQGAQFATFKIILPGEKNPFGRGGLWSFRCPAKL